jgi:CheY-like chemotaxis protein
MKTVFIIDNNYEYREALKAVLEDRDVEVIESDCPDSAYRLLATMDTPDLIVCDLHMPFTTGADMNDYKISYEVGLRTMHELAWVFPDTPVIALAGINEHDLERVRRFVDPIPAYAKTGNVHHAADIVKGFLASRELGGVQ